MALQSWINDEEPSTNMQGLCHQHGLIMIGPRTFVLRSMAGHFDIHHDGQNVVSEGIDFRLEVAPARCDLCGAVAEAPWWCHAANAAPNDLATGTSPSPTVVDADGQWLVCDPCHVNLLERNLNKLVIKNIRELVLQSPSIDRAEIYHVAREQLKLVMALLTDAGVREGPGLP